ncbi:hypothetical protein AAC387_Pa02g2872 [Persea americana]
MGSTTSTYRKKKKQQQHRLPDVCRRLSLLLRQSSTATMLMEGGPHTRSNLIDCREMQSTTKQFWFRTILCHWRRRRSPEKETVAETRDSVQRSPEKKTRQSCVGGPIIIDGEEGLLERRPDSLLVSVCIRLIGDGEECRSSAL